MRPATLAAAALLALGASAGLAGTPDPMRPPREQVLALDVPPIRQSRERCGEAALEMVFRYHHASDSLLTMVDAAYDPVLRGSLITDLAGVARRAGFEAHIVKLDADSLLALLAAGTPPIVLYQAGPAPLTTPHYAVLVGWERGRYTLCDGGRRPRRMAEGALEARRRSAGSLVLVVTRPARPR